MARKLKADEYKLHLETVWGRGGVLMQKGDLIHQAEESDAAEALLIQEILIHFLRFSGALGRLAWTCGLTRTWGRTRPPKPGAADTVAGMDAVEVTEDFLASSLLSPLLSSSSMECCIEILGLGTGMAEADVDD